ncbi:hypothetical protein ACR6C2_13440 [Streptomyces sp. INA 01156]
MNSMQTGGIVLMAVTGTPGMGRSSFLDAVAVRAEQHGFVVRRARAADWNRACPRPPRSGPPGTHRPPGRAARRRPAAGGEPALTRLTALLADPGPGPLLMAVAVCEGEFATETPGVQEILSAADQVIRMGPLGTEGIRALLGNTASCSPTTRPTPGATPPAATRR